MSSKIALCAFGVQGIQKFVSCSLVHHLLMYLCIHGACIACAAMLIIVQACLCGNAHVAYGRAHCTHIYNAYRHFAIFCNAGLYRLFRGISLSDLPHMHWRSTQYTGGHAKWCGSRTGGVGNTPTPSANGNPVLSTIAHCCHLSPFSLSS